MNRLPDLKATLGANLDVLAPFSDRVEVIIACFDEDDSCEAWVLSNFAEQVTAGWLKFVRQEPLPFWHFSRAKNAFLPHLSGRYYSSLDGDNFLTREGVSNTLGLLETTNLEYVVHHWSGHWGDGTSGRVTVPRWVYQEIGYISSIFPRQFDEFGLVLRALERYPWLIFAGRSGVDAIGKSGYLASFLKSNGLAVNRVHVDLGEVVSPENPRGVEYVRQDEKLQFYQTINANFTLYQSSRTQAAKDKYADSLKTELALLCRSTVCRDVLSVTFSGRALECLTESDEPTLYSVVHNDFHLLRPWLTHYRTLGVKRFVIVDDNSNPPLDEYLSDPDVFVLRPLVGDFKTFKIVWLKMLMNTYQRAGSWVLTADSDEFIDIPTHLCSGSRGELPLETLCRNLEAKQLDYAPALLVDLLPSGTLNDSADDCLEQMRYHLWRPPSSSCGYDKLKPIRWAFSDYWPASFRVDARYRLFGTIDCLRKLPVFRYDQSVELNQGFHALHKGSRHLTAEEVWQDPDVVLPVRHYKMASILGTTSAFRERRGKIASYFGRTTHNLNRMYNADTDEIRRTWHLTPFKRIYDKDTGFFR